VVAERRLRFFAFDLHSDDGARADLEEALRTLGFDAADMRHCDDAGAAQAVIGEIEAQRNDLDYDLDGAVLRLADRNAFAAAGTRANSPRGALAFKYAAEEKTTLLADVVWDVGKIGKVAPVAVLEPVFVGGTTVTRATLANQEVIRARDVRIGDTVLVRRAGDVIPFVAGVLDASVRTGEEREIVPPSECPSCGQALIEQGQQPRALLHQRRLPGPDGAPADPLGLARGRRHRRDRPGLDRAAQRGRSARAPVRLLRARARPPDGLRRHRGRVRGPDARVDRPQPRRWPAPRADRPRDPDGFRATATRLCRAGFRALEEVADADEEALQEVEDIGPKVAASLRSHLGRASTRAELARLRELGVDLDVRDEDLPPQIVSGAPLAGKTVVVSGSITDPRSGEKVARPVFQRLCERPARRPRRRSRPAPTC
jgi:DNA ligase (NAD+)